MREGLTTTAATAAKATRFVQRTSSLGGATFSQTLVFGFLGHPRASLEALTQMAATLGVPITPQALDQRFTPAAASCLEQGLRAAIPRRIAADAVAMPLLERCTAVWGQDKRHHRVAGGPGDSVARLWGHHDHAHGRRPQVPGPTGVAHGATRGATVARRSGLGPRRARAHDTAQRRVVAGGRGGLELGDVADPGSARGGLAVTLAGPERSL